MEEKHENSRTNKGRTGTGKTSRIYMNKNIIEALKAYKICAQIKGSLSEEAYLYAGPHGTPISRVQAWRIISRAADACELPGVISPHSLRKTSVFKQSNPKKVTHYLMCYINHTILFYPQYKGMYVNKEVKNAKTHITAR